MPDYIATDEYPYQMVALFEHHVTVGDRIYKGPRGWLPQITLKRRFGLRALAEETFVGEAKALLSQMPPLRIEFGEAVKGKLPVEVIEVTNAAPYEFYDQFVRHFGRHVVSRYPDREGANYYPHMTIEWNGKRVVQPDKFIGTTHTVWDLWLIKDDVAADDSRIHTHFQLRQTL